MNVVKKSLALKYSKVVLYITILGLEDFFLKSVYLRVDRELYIFYVCIYISSKILVETVTDFIVTHITFSWNGRKKEQATIPA